MIKLEFDWNKIADHISSAGKVYALCKIRCNWFAAALRWIFVIKASCILSKICAQFFCFGVWLKEVRFSFWCVQCFITICFLQGTPNKLLLFTTIAYLEKTVGALSLQKSESCDWLGHEVFFVVTIFSAICCRDSTLKLHCETDKRMQTVMRDHFQ